MSDPFTLLDRIKEYGFGIVALVLGIFNIVITREKVNYKDWQRVKEHDIDKFKEDIIKNGVLLTHSEHMIICETAKDEMKETLTDFRSTLNEITESMNRAYTNADKMYIKCLEAIQEMQEKFDVNINELRKENNENIKDLRTAIGNIRAKVGV